MPIDEFDTPPQLAAELIKVAGGLAENEPSIIADFAVGTGELLLAAKKRWPRAIAFGCDISHDRVESLSQDRSEWTITRCDFLDCASRSTVSDLERIKTRVDLSVLNPPFSVRGGTRIKVRFDDQDVRCSPAMAFVLLAAQYLSHDGNLVALLPAGALESDRDREARAALRRQGDFRPIDSTTARFPGGNPKVTITYFKRGLVATQPCGFAASKFNPTRPISELWKTTDDRVSGLDAPSASRYLPTSLEPINTIKVLRGTLENQVASTVEEPGGIPLVHSTELQGYRLRATQREVPPGTRSLTGPAVLLHRVGRPRQDKIALVPKRPPFAITDCVLALLSHDADECLRLQRSLTENFSLLERNYVGSGAPYITIERVQDVLRRLGFASEVTNWQTVARSTG